MDGHSLMGVSYLRYLLARGRVPRRLTQGPRTGLLLTAFVDFRAVDLIRRGGKKMRFLVAKSDMETARKIRFRTPPP